MKTCKARKYTNDDESSDDNIPLSRLKVVDKNINEEISDESESIVDSEDSYNQIKLMSIHLIQTYPLLCRKVTIPALTLKIPAGKYPSGEKYALRKGRKNYQSLEGRKISPLRKTP